MTRQAASVARLIATVAALVAGQTVLWRAGAALPPLPLGPAGAARTFTEADPLALAIAMVRLAALAVGAGLLALTALGIVARGCGAVRLAVHVDRWTPPSLRRLLDGALGIGLAASIGLSPAPAGAAAGDPRPAASTTIKRLTDAPATTLRRLPDATPGRTTPGLSLRRLPDAALDPSGQPQSGSVPVTPSGSAAAPPAAGAGAPAPPAATPPVPSDAPSTAYPTAAPAATAVAPPAATTASAAGEGEVVVQPGESFWLLAQQHEADRLGRQPTESEIRACWRELVAVNRHRLVVADDPDLLFPGQRLILPCR